MKYFSPAVLDGSVTTAKLADNAVTLPKMADNSVSTAEIITNTIVRADLAGAIIAQNKVLSSTSSQSGSITGNGKVVVTLSSHTFFPDIEAASTSDEQPVLAVGIAAPAASADAPEFQIDNTNIAARDYSVAWRHISA